MLICSEKKNYFPSIEFCCSKICVTVFDDILNKNWILKIFSDQKLQLIVVLVLLVAIKKNNHFDRLQNRYAFKHFILAVFKCYFRCKKEKWKIEIVDQQLL